jgi:hypothetical protein
MRQAAIRAKMNGSEVKLITYFSMKIKGSKTKGIIKVLHNHSWEQNYRVCQGMPVVLCFIIYEG